MGARSAPAAVPPTRRQPSLHGHASVAWTASVLASFHAALIVTDHDGVDYAALVEHCPLVLDTRNACARAGVPYATAFDQRFHPAHIALANLVRTGALGRVFAVRIAYCCWVGPDFQGDNWRVDRARAGGGALIDLAPHGLDLASVLLGEALDDVAALGQSRVQDYAVEDGAVLLARSRSGVLVQSHVAYNCPETYPRRRLEVLGTAAQVVATDTMGQTPGGTLVLTDAATGAARTLDVPGADRSPFLNQAEAFAAACLARAPFAYPPAHDLHVMELTSRAQSQAEAGLSHAA